MGKAKEQHYVPQFHLRAFASDKNEKCINVYNLNRKESFENVPIKGQGKKPYLYGKNNGVEVRLGKIEGLLASSFKQIVQSGAIGQEHIDLILLFINLSFIRTYQTISDLLGTTSEAQEVMKRNNPELRRMIDSFDFSSEVVGELVLSAVEKAWINSLDLKIALIQNTTNKDFITSDSPASRYNFYLEKKEYPLGPTAITMAGVCAFVPLTPRILAVAYDDDIMEIIKNEIDEIEDVDTVNKIQVLNAGDSVFCQNSESCVAIREYLSAVETYRGNERYQVQSLEDIKANNGNSLRRQMGESLAAKLPSHGFVAAWGNNYANLSCNFLKIKPDKIDMEISENPLRPYCFSVKDKSKKLPF